MVFSLLSLLGWLCWLLYSLLFGCCLRLGVCLFLISFCFVVHLVLFVDFGYCDVL